MQEVNILLLLTMMIIFQIVIYKGCMSAHRLMLWWFAMCILLVALREESFFWIIGWKMYICAKLLISISIDLFCLSHGLN